MHPLSVVLHVIRAGIAISAVVGLASGTWAFMSDVLLDGLSVTHAMIWGGLALATGIWATFAVLRGLEVVIGWLPEFKEASRVASRLEQMATVTGANGLSVQEIVNMWFEEQPANKVARLGRKTVLYGVMRIAAERGLIRIADGSNLASTSYICHIKDTVSFLRSHRWKLIALQGR